MVEVYGTNVFVFTLYTPRMECFLGFVGLLYFQEGDMRHGRPGAARIVPCLVRISSWSVTCLAVFLTAIHKRELVEENKRP